jgi:hypothetical protein
MFPLDEEAVDARADAFAARDLTLLKAIAADPAGTERKWAIATGFNRRAVQTTLEHLARDKLVTKKLRRWTLTKDGEHMVDAEQKGNNSNEF